MLETQRCQHSDPAAQLSLQQHTTRAASQGIASAEWRAGSSCGHCTLKTRYTQVLAGARSHPDGVGLGQQGIVSGFDFCRMERLCAHGASHQGTSNHKPAVAPQPGLERAAGALEAAAHVTRTVGVALQALLPAWSCAGAWPVGHCKQRARVGCRMATQHRRTHRAEVQRNALLHFHAECLGCLQRSCTIQRLLGCCALSVNRQCTQGRLTSHSCGDGWMACSQY